MQQTLFGGQDAAKPTIKGLVIAKAGKKKLTKSQSDFNKITLRIEKLQKELTNKQLQFDQALQLYGTEITPATFLVSAARRRVIDALWEIYRLRKVAKSDLRHLKNILQHYLNNHFGEIEGEPDEQLKAILLAIEGISYEQMMEDEKESMKEEMEEMFEYMNIDPDEVDMDDEEDVEKKMIEAKIKMMEQQEKEAEQFRKRQANRKKTKREIEYEKNQAAIAEMKQKNISTIYKQLAKLFHPDLEQDADRKIEKEILMKELILAYEAKNLHTLLTLELKWIHNENDHLESLTEEKLAIYLQILKEQASELEYKKRNMFMHPQYNVLAEVYGYAMQHKAPLAVVDSHINALKGTAQNFNHEADQFESEKANKFLKEMIRQWKIKKAKEEDDEYDPDEIMRMIFGK